MRRLVFGIFLIIFALFVPAAYSQAPVNLRQALEAIQSKDYQKAIALLESEVKRSPDMEEAHYYLGLALWEVGRRGEGIAELKKARQFAPKNPEYIYALGNFLLDQKMFAEAKDVFRDGLKQKNKANFLYGLGRTYIAQDSLDQALVFLLQAREADPNNSKIYRSIGDAYAKQKVLSLAIDNYRKAIEIEPGWLEVHFIMGKMYYKERRFTEALVSFKKAVELDPANAEAHFEVGNLYYLAKRPMDALPELEAFVKLQPKSYEGYLVLAKAQYAVRKFDEAAASAERAYQINSTTDALELLAKVYYESRDSTSYKKSAQAYTKLAQTDSYQLDAESYLKWGRALSKLQRYAEAIPKYEASLRIDSTQIDAYFEVGGLYLREKRYDEAIAAYDRKIKSDSTSARTYFNIGMCYMHKQDFPNAVAALRTGLRFENDYKPAWIWLAQSYSQIDSSAESKAAYEQVLRLDANNAEANRQIGVYYLVKRNFDSAINYLKKSVEIDPTNEMAHLWLAQAYHSAFKVPEARVEYNIVLKINPKNADAIKGLKLLESVQ